jgi:glycosyltransferase involved in cell wall biosynthesis
MIAVSVVVPAHQREDLLGDTLASVQRQTFTDWECIVVDDGSTDGTGAVARAFAARDPRFRCVRRPRSSAAAARNHGLALARGRYASFLDSDDLFEPDKLAWQHAALEAEPRAVLVYGDTWQFLHEDPARGGLYLERVARKPAGDAFEELLVCSSIYSPTVRVEALRAVGGFDERLVSAEDWDAWLALARVGRIVYRPRVALRYRIHSGNKSADLLRNLGCARLVAEKHIAATAPERRKTLARASHRHLRAAYASPLLERACERTRAGDWASARLLWRALVRLDPRALARRSVAAHALWALLPTGALPPWQRRRVGRAADVPAEAVR